MTKHTPAPWFYNGTEIGPLSTEEDQSRGIILPIAYMEQYDFPAEYNANARLIAAAPDLLEALEGMIEGFTVDDRYASESVIKARAAIAKATGETK